MTAAQIRATATGSETETLDFKLATGPHPSGSHLCRDLAPVS